MKASLEAELMRPWVVGSGGHSPPYPWIPAPRSHEDKLRGNDGRECPPKADRESEGVPRSTFFLFPQEWGIKGVENPIWTNHPNG